MALSLDGDPVLDGFDLSALLLRFALLDAVALAAAEPLDFCESSVINESAARVLQRLGVRLGSPPVRMVLQDVGFGRAHKEKEKQARTGTASARSIVTQRDLWQ